LGSLLGSSLLSLLLNLFAQYFIVFLVRRDPRARQLRRVKRLPHFRGIELRVEEDQIWREGTIFMRARAGSCTIDQRQHEATDDQRQHEAMRQHALVTPLRVAFMLLSHACHKKQHWKSSGAQRTFVGVLRPVLLIGSKLAYNALT
jgi:hypothetical protein